MRMDKKQKLAEEFLARADRPKCNWCQKPILLCQDYWRESYQESGCIWGLRGNGVFCDESCAIALAETVVDRGFTLKDTSPR